MIKPLSAKLREFTILSNDKRVFLVSQTPHYSIVHNGKFIIELSPRQKCCFIGGENGLSDNKPKPIDEAILYLRQSKYEIDHQVLSWLLFNLEMFL